MYPMLFSFSDLVKDSLLILTSSRHRATLAIAMFDQAERIRCLPSVRAGYRMSMRSRSILHPQFRQKSAGYRDQAPCDEDVGMCRGTFPPDEERCGRSGTAGGQFASCCRDKGAQPGWNPNSPARNNRLLGWRGPTLFEECRKWRQTYSRQLATTDS